MKPFVLPALAGAMLTMFAAASLAAAPDDAQLETGKTLFLTGAVPACAVCHTLQDAQATGTIGPDLDELKPDAARVKKIMVEGAGAMPSFAATLDDAAMDAISAYVAHATGADAK